MQPKDLGGLGITDLDKFGRALRLRWLWYEWTETSRPWVGFGTPCDAMNRILFNASTVITIGNRKNGFGMVVGSKGRPQETWHHTS